jgi:hypothetical protein
VAETGYVQTASKKIFFLKHVQRKGEEEENRARSLL